MIKKLVYLPLLILLTYCDSMPKDWNWGFRPRPFSGLSGFPSANTDYGAGFKDGCAIGWSSVAKGAVTDFMPMRLNTKQITKNVDYRSGWWDGYEQCVYIYDHDVI